MAIEYFLQSLCFTHTINITEHTSKEENKVEYRYRPSDETIKRDSVLDDRNFKEKM